MRYEKLMQEASAYSREADEANAHAEELEAVAASLRAQADQKSDEAQLERDLANRKLAAAQAAARTAMSGPSDETTIDAFPRQQRTNMSATSTGDRRDATVHHWWGNGGVSLAAIAAAIAAGIALLLLLLWWNYGRSPAVAESSAVKQGLDNVATKVDQVLAGVTTANTKLDKIGGETAQIPEIKENTAKAASAAASAASAAAACKQACEKKPAAVTPAKRAPAAKAATAGPDIHKPSAMECRWASNGMLRLKEATSLLPADPLKEIPYGVTVETTPKAKLGAGETCASWQGKLEARKADLTPRDRATFHK